MTSVSARVICYMKPRSIVIPVGGDIQQMEHAVLPPVPIDTKLNGDDIKQQIMELYPDLFFRCWCH